MKLLWDNDIKLSYKIISSINTMIYIAKFSSVITCNWVYDTDQSHTVVRTLAFWSISIEKNESYVTWFIVFHMPFNWLRRVH